MKFKKNIQQKLSPDPRKRYSLVLPLIHKHPSCIHASPLPISFTKYLFRTRARGKREGKRIIRQVTGGKVQPSFHRTILQNFSTNYPPRRDHETRNRGSNINFPNFAYDPSLEYSCCSIVSNASVIQFLFLSSFLPRFVCFPETFQGRLIFHPSFDARSNVSTVSFTMRQIMSKMGIVRV